MDDLKTHLLGTLFVFVSFIVILIIAEKRKKKRWAKPQWQPGDPFNSLRRYEDFKKHLDSVSEQEAVYLVISNFNWFSKWLEYEKQLKPNIFSPNFRTEKYRISDEDYSTSDSMIRSLIRNRDNKILKQWYYEWP